MNAPKRAEGEYKLLQERIKGIELLTEEQLQQLSAEKEELQVRLSVLKEKETLYPGKLKWLEEEGQLEYRLHTDGRNTFGCPEKNKTAVPRYELLSRIAKQAAGISAMCIWNVMPGKQTTAGRSRLNKEIQVAIQKNTALQTSATARWEAAQKAQTEFKGLSIYNKDHNWIRLEHWMCNWQKIENKLVES